MFNKFILLAGFIISTTIISCSNDTPTSSIPVDPIVVDPNLIITDQYRYHVTIPGPYVLQECFYESAVQTCTDWNADTEGNQTSLKDGTTEIRDIFGNLSFREYVLGDGIKTAYFMERFTFDKPIKIIPDTILINGQVNYNYTGSYRKVKDGKATVGNISLSVATTVSLSPSPITIGTTTFTDLILAVSTQTLVVSTTSGTELERTVTQLNSYYARDFGLIKSEGLDDRTAVSRTLSSISINGAPFITP